MSQDSFIAYSLPGSTEHIYATIADIVPMTTESDVDAYDFVVAPFDRQNEATYLIKFSSEAAQRKFEAVPSLMQDGLETSYSEYKIGYERIQQGITNTEFEKVILSRLKFVPAQVEDLYELFVAIKNKHKDAFTYLLQHPGLGNWMGASPELVLEKVDNGSLRTRAIAGTRPTGSGIVNWNQKEIDEHRFIETHIRQALDERSTDYSISESYTLKAGRVAHICSDISLSVNFSFQELMDIIHPGPALSGMPMKEAQEHIRKTELHSRDLYCGFLGPILGGIYSLFANIRCMQNYRNGHSLYLGGGITSGSELESEWMETEYKATTLMDLLPYQHESKAEL